MTTLIMILIMILIKLIITLNMTMILIIILIIVSLYLPFISIVFHQSCCSQQSSDLTMLTVFTLIQRFEALLSPYIDLTENMYWKF